MKRKIKTQKRNKRYWQAILDEAFDKNKSGHWISLNGLFRLFGVKKNQRYSFGGAIANIALKRTVTSVKGSYGEARASIFYFTPLLNQRYWQKIVDLKKKIPLKKYDVNLKKNKWLPDHGYQMLLNQPLIPNYQQFKMFQNVDKSLVPFDYDFYAEKFKKAKDEQIKKIRCVQTGEIWPSISYAAKCLKISPATLYCHIKKKKTDRGIKQLDGLHFQIIL